MTAALDGHVPSIACLGATRCADFSRVRCNVHRCGLASANRFAIDASRHTDNERTLGAADKAESGFGI
jgi:hypothetical protein